MTINEVKQRELERLRTLKTNKKNPNDLINQKAQLEKELQQAINSLKTYGEDSPIARTLQEQIRTLRVQINEINKALPQITNQTTLNCET